MAIGQWENEVVAVKELQGRYLPHHVELLRELDDKSTTNRVPVGPRLDRFNIVVHHKQPGTGGVQPPKTNIRRKAIGLITVLNERLEINSR